MPKSYAEQMVDLKDAYRNSGGEWPASATQIATWAVHSGKWDQEPGKKIKTCARDLADAMRQETHTDRQGRVVRTMAAAQRTIYDEDGKQSQQWLWCDIRDGNHDHVLQAFYARRSQTARDVQSLKADIESYNANYLPAGREPINMTFDFDFDAGSESDAA